MSINQPTEVYLPSPHQRGNLSLEEAIVQRRSTRDFTAESISQSQLSQILWAAQGISDASWRYRTVPSAGATYQLELFVVCGGKGIKGLLDASKALAHIELLSHGAEIEEEIHLLDHYLDHTRRLCESPKEEVGDWERRDLNA